MLDGGCSSRDVAAKVRVDHKACATEGRRASGLGGRPGTLDVDERLELARLRREAVMLELARFKGADRRVSLERPVQEDAVPSLSQRGRLLGHLRTSSSTAAGDVSGDVTPAGAGVRVLPADYVAEQVELAYASTVHGVQGDTVTAAHVVLGHQTGAASAYVGMTRGRASNTAYLIAADLAEARAQWIAAFGRDCADLGPGHAAEQAAPEAARDRQLGSIDRLAAAPPRPTAPAGVRRPEAERRGPSLTRGGAAPGIGR